MKDIDVRIGETFLYENEWYRIMRIDRDSIPESDMAKLKISCVKFAEEVEPEQITKSGDNEQ